MRGDYTWDYGPGDRVIITQVVTVLCKIPNSDDWAVLFDDGSLDRVNGGLLHNALTNPGERHSHPPQQWSEWKELTTNVLDRHNDLITLQMKHCGKRFIVSDDCTTIHDIKAAGLADELSDPRSEISFILRYHQIHSEGDELRVYGDKEFSSRIGDLTTAIQEINQHIQQSNGVSP